MVIAIDARIANRENMSGGGIYLKSLLKEMMRIDSVNQYILYLDEDPDPSLIDSRNNVDFRVIRLPIAWTQLRLSRALLSERPQVFFSPHHWLPLVSGKCRTVVTIHDLAFLEYPEYFGFKSALYFKWSTHHALKSADKIITISQATKADILRHFAVDENKIKVIYLGFDQVFATPLQHGKSKEILSKYQLDGKYLFFLGDLHLRKNVPRVIQAFAQLKQKNGIEHKLVITGKKDWSTHRILETIKNSEVACDIVLTGYVPREELPYLMGNAELFVFPSLFEGFGIPLLEAMAANTPIVTSNVTSMPEIVADAAITVDPNSVIEIAHAIEILLTNPTLRRDLVRKGHRRLKDFSWTKTAEETIDYLCTD